MGFQCCCYPFGSLSKRSRASAGEEVHFATQGCCERQVSRERRVWRLFLKKIIDSSLIPCSTFQNLCGIEVPCIYIPAVMPGQHQYCSAYLSSSPQLETTESCWQKAREVEVSSWLSRSTCRGGGKRNRVKLLKTLATKIKVNLKNTWLKMMTSVTDMGKGGQNLRANQTVMTPGWKLPI